MVDVIGKNVNKEIGKENQRKKGDWRKAKQQEGEERETKDLRDNRKEKKQGDEDELNFGGGWLTAASKLLFDSDEGFGFK